MATSYQELEQALENAYAQVQSMSAIIGVLLEFRTSQGSYQLTREAMENNYDNFIVEVVPHDDYIEIKLKAK